MFLRAVRINDGPRQCSAPMKFRAALRGGSRLELLLDSQDGPGIEAAKDQIPVDQHGRLELGLGQARRSGAGASTRCRMLGNFSRNLLGLSESDFALQHASHNSARANVEFRRELYFVFLADKFHCAVYGLGNVFGRNGKCMSHSYPTSLKCSVEIVREG